MNGTKRRTVMPECSTPWLIHGIATLMGLAMLITGVAARAEGGNERSALEAAAQGRFDDVTIVFYLEGYFAVPKSFVLIGIGSEHAHPHFSVSLNSKSSIRSGGYIEFGDYLRRTDGAIVDMHSGVLLVSQPMHEVQHGSLTIDMSGDGSAKSIRAVLITKGAQYVELTGGAVTIANEFIEAYESLSGPPLAFSPNWTPHANRVSLIPVIDAIGEVDELKACILRSLRPKPIFSGSPINLSLKVDQSADVKKLGFLNLSLGDVVISARGHPLDSTFDVVAEIERVASTGSSLELGVVRGGADIKVVIAAGGAAALVASCRQETR